MNSTFDPTTAYGPPPPWFEAVMFALLIFDARDDIPDTLAAVQAQSLIDSAP